MRIESKSMLIVHFFPAVVLFFLALLLVDDMNMHKANRALEQQLAASQQECRQLRGELETARQQAEELGRAHQTLQQAHLTLQEQLRQAQTYIQSLEERLNSSAQLQAGSQVGVQDVPVNHRQVNLAGTAATAVVPETSRPLGLQLTSGQQRSLTVTGFILLILFTVAAAAKRWRDGAARSGTGSDTRCIGGKCRCQACPLASGDARIARRERAALLHKQRRPCAGHLTHPSTYSGGESGVRC